MLLCPLELTLNLECGEALGRVRLKQCQQRHSILTRRADFAHAILRLEVPFAGKYKHQRGVFDVAL